MRRATLAVLAAGAIAAGCGGGDGGDELVAVAVTGHNPVDGVLWCEPDDVVADLTSARSFPPNVDAPPLPEAEADQKAEDFVQMLFARGPAATAGRHLEHDGGPVATVTLTWPDERGDRARAGGWLTFELVDGAWTVTGYTVCNRFAFGG